MNLYRLESVSYTHLDVYKRQGEDGQVHRGMGDQQADDRTGDHRTEHEGRHVVTGLFQQPHGQNSREEDVNEGDVAPTGLAQNDGGVHADDEGQHDEDDADDSLFPAGEVELLLDQAKDCLLYTSVRRPSA